jgi:hypothetical protein
MADDSDPPRKFYQLKPKEFARVNEPPRSPGDAPPPPANQSAAGSANPPSGRIDVRDLARQAAGGAPLLGVNAPVNRPNDVHAILQENLQQANAAGLNDLAPKPKRRSKRNRDYWLTFVSVNAFFLFWIFGPLANGITILYGAAGIILFSIGFTWVMFFVVDDY